MDREEKKIGATESGEIVKVEERSEPIPMQSVEAEVRRRMSFVRHEVNNVLAILSANFDYVKELIEERKLDLGEDGEGAFDDMGGAIGRLGEIARMSIGEIDKRASQFDASPSENQNPVKEGAVECARQKTVFLIDDEAALASVLKRIILRDFNDGKKPEVMVFSSALEAKKSIESGIRPDYTLCDLMMPGMTGGMYYGWLKEAHPELANKILFMSGGTFGNSTNDPNIKKIIENKILLSKPFDNQNILDRVKKALGDK